MEQGPRESPDSINRENALAVANPLGSQRELSVRSTPDMIDQRKRIGRQSAAAPGQMLVQALQEEPAAVENGGIRPFDVRTSIALRARSVARGVAFCHSSSAPEFLTITAQRSTSVLT